MNDWAKLFKTTEEQYCYSYDGDSFLEAYDTREEAVSAAVQANPIAPIVYTAIVVKKSPSEFIPDADEMIDIMNLRANEMLGEEFIEGWPGTKFQEDLDLKAYFYEVYALAIDKFFKNQDMEPEFYVVNEIQKHEV